MTEPEQPGTVHRYELRITGEAEVIPGPDPAEHEQDQEEDEAT